ncbi:MAG: hypothetical protein EOM25_02005 [Deltaproteobacteria bacterium]|nr:hypothetical protein [Deltaproteobacteria bacterium]
MSVGFLSRPLVSALLWAAMTGDMVTPILVAVFFELFWLDLIPVGTFIPPMASYASLASIVTVERLGQLQVMQIAAIMAASALLAMIGAWLESRQRVRQNISFNTLLAWSRRGMTERYRPERLVLKSILQQLAMHGAFFFVSVWALITFGGMAVALVPDMEWMNWNVLWLFASLGGLLSLRIAKAYAVFGLSCCLVALVFLSMTLT